MKKTLSLLLISVFVLTTNAQTLHFISMFDTNDPKIGSGMKRERMLVNNEMRTIAGYLEEFGYDSQFCDCYGTNCGRTSLMQVINSLEVESNDVVIFYYGGMAQEPIIIQKTAFHKCVWENRHKATGFLPL